MIDEGKFARDSPLEGAGFEPSVPRDAIKMFKTRSCRLRVIPPTRRYGGANEIRGREHADVGRLPGDRWFESISRPSGVKVQQR